MATGALSRGAAVPSIRELARALMVNPATVAKAYQRLTNADVLVVRRGEGTFVAEAAPQMRRSERIRILREAALRYAGAAVSVGASTEEAVAEVELALGKTLAAASSQGQP